MKQRGLRMKTKETKMEVIKLSDNLFEPQVYKDLARVTAERDALMKHCCNDDYSCWMVKVEGVPCVAETCPILHHAPSQSSELPKFKEPGQ